MQQLPVETALSTLASELEVTMDETNISLEVGKCAD